MSSQQHAKKAIVAAMQRMIGQAFQEGASEDTIRQHLIEQGMQDPDAIISRVKGFKMIPLLGGAELKLYGGRTKFRALFGLPTADEPMHEPAPYDFPLTEEGDAEHFAQMFHDRVRHDHRRSRWLISDDDTGLWLPDKTDEMIQLAVASQRARQERALLIEDQVKRKPALDWATRGENRNRLNNLLALASSIPPLADSGEHWDEDPSLLGVGNGVVDLRTATVRRALPEERITMRSRIEFDPTATSELWQETLHAIFATPAADPSMDPPTSPADLLAERPADTQCAEMVGFMQRALGYSITGDCREECCFFAWGSGANGKGTILNTCGLVLGDYTDDMPYTTLEKQMYGGISSDVAKLDKKRFITSSEVNEFHVNESRLKALTGRDPITARFLYENEFTFQPVCKIWVATNNKPKIKGQDDGIWRRIYLIAFLNDFSGDRKDLTLKDRLKQPENMKAILNWLVQGAKIWYERGLEPPQFVKAMTEEYRHESDPLTPFFEQACVLTEKAKADGTDLWSAYVEFCNQNGIDDAWRISQKAFFMALRKRFKASERRNESRSKVAVFHGVGLMDRRHGHAETSF